jgi:hypothetical protein
MTTDQLALSADVSMRSPRPGFTELVAVHCTREVIRTPNVRYGRRQVVDHTGEGVAYFKIGFVTTLAAGVAVWAIIHLSHHER